MNPYAIIAGLLMTIAAAFGGEHVGRKLERSAWQAKELASLGEYAKGIAAEHEKYVALQASNEAIARKITADHEQALAALTAQYDAARAAIRAAGGLRVSRSICADSNATAAQASGAGRPDEAGAGTAPLPPEVERRLLELTKEADAVAEQLRALQQWVKAEGGYGQ